MSKEKLRDLIICISAITILVLVITTNAFAASDVETMGQELNNSNNNSGEFSEIRNSNTNNIITNTNSNTNSNTNTNSNSNKNVNTNANSNSNTNKSALPYGGVDYSVVAIIAVCGVSAVYAYKKIRDYKSL